MASNYLMVIHLLVLAVVLSMVTVNYASLNQPGGYQYPNAAGSSQPYESQSAVPLSQDEKIQKQIQQLKDIREAKEKHLAEQLAARPVPFQIFRYSSADLFQPRTEEEWKKLFNSIDPNLTKRVSMEYIKQVIRKTFVIPLSGLQIQLLLAAAATVVPNIRDGQIDYNTFKIILWNGFPIDHTRLWELFIIADQQQQWAITFQQLNDAINYLEIKFLRLEQTRFDAVDLDHDGFISFQELVELFHVEVSQLEQL